MKKIYFLLTAVVTAMTGMFQTANAQGDCLSSGGCPFNLIEQWPAATIDIQSTEFVFVTEESYIGDHMVFMVNSGVTYVWSLCSDDGAIASTEAADSEFVLFNSSNQTLLCYSDDFCGTLPRIEWTANFTGTVTLQFNVDGCAAVPNVNNRIVFKADQITGVEETAVAESIDVFPNPASDMITINYNKRTNENVSVTMISSDGRVIFSGNEISANGFVKVVDVRNLASGMYFIQLTSASGSTIQKVMIQ